MSERYYCHNCWTAWPREALLYRCPLCGDPDLPAWARGSGQLRPVKDLLPPWYRRLLSDETPVACPRHPKDGDRLQLHCPTPTCQTRLGANSRLRRGNPLALGVAGPRSAGKTLFTLMLVREVGRRQVAGRSLGLVGLDETEERFSALAACLRDGEKPEPTPEAREAKGGPAAQNFCWQIQSAGSDHPGAEPALLSIYDVGGETWKQPVRESLTGFDQYVASLTSLVFLIDGTAVARDLGFQVEDAWDPEPGADAEDWVDRQFLARIVDRLGRRSRKVDVALVVSKADHLWDRAGWEALKPGSGASAAEAGGTVKRLLDESGRSGLWTQAHQSFRQVRPFAVSSLGFRPGPGEVDGAGKLVREARPVGVSDPVVWLLGLRLPLLREQELR